MYFRGGGSLQPNYRLSINQRSLRVGAAWVSAHRSIAYLRFSVAATKERERVCSSSRLLATGLLFAPPRQQSVSVLYLLPAFVMFLLSLFPSESGVCMWGGSVSAVTLSPTRPLLSPLLYIHPRPESNNASARTYAHPPRIHPRFLDHPCYLYITCRSATPNLCSCN